jgi:hypothetical protein
MIVLDEIIFNEGKAKSRPSAVNIRQNASKFLHGPEWRRLVCVNPEDSRVVYALTGVRSGALTIKASFISTLDGVNVAEVRVRRQVKSRRVAFKNGRSGFVRFELINPPTRHGQIGIWDLEWNWEYRLGRRKPWRPLAASHHRIYVVLDVPKNPWHQLPYVAANTQLVWTDVLDFACRWAAGARTIDQAAALITSSAYALGPEIITYDCRGGGNSNYSYPDFDCTAFLERLRGGIGNGLYVNCSDCAAVVSTFANALGCDLWQSRMGWDFALNELLAIGGSSWQTPCGWYWFQYHEVAWKDSCSSTDDIFDACLQVDGDDDPTQSPHRPLLPSALRFDKYVDRLASPAGRPNCTPRPQTRQRRRLV